MTQERIGFFKVFLVIFGTLIIGSIWLAYNISTPTPPKYLLKKDCEKNSKDNLLDKQYWKMLADNIVKDFQGKIISIEQLNSTACWAVLSPVFTRIQSAALAEIIGSYIRNFSGSSQEMTPSIHVFVRGQHIAVARLSDKSYVGKISIQHWDPSVFKGRCRP